MMQDLKEIRRTLNVMTLQLDTTEMKLNESNIRLQEIQAKSTDIYATGEDTNNRVREGQAWMERQERSRAQIEDLAELRKPSMRKTLSKLLMPFLGSQLCCGDFQKIRHMVVKMQRKCRLLC